MNTANNPWWVSPSAVVGFFILPIFLLLSYDMLVSNSLQKFDLILYYDFESFVVAFVCLVAFALSAWITERSSNKNIRPSKVFLASERLLIVFGVVTVLANLLIIKYLIFNPQVFIAYLIGDFSAFHLKSLAGNVPGITSFSQLGILFASVYFLDVARGRVYKNKRVLLVVMVCILFLCFVRSVYFAERLALLEVIIPIVLIVATHRFPVRAKPLRIILLLAPFVGLVFLYFIFIGAEYNRSWRGYYSNYFDSVFEFGYVRLGLYYTTALNNGALVAQYGDGLFLQYILDWLYKLPVIGAIFMGDMSGASYDGLLKGYANPEFNNLSGVLAYYIDLGLLVVPFFVLLGIVFGSFFNSFIKAQGRYACLYPCMYIFVVEMLRIPYITSSRFFLVAVGFFLLAYFGRYTVVNASRKV